MSGEIDGVDYGPTTGIPFPKCKDCGEHTYKCHKCGKHPCPNCSPLKETPWGQVCPFCGNLMNVYHDPPDDMPRHEWEKGFKNKSPGDYDIYQHNKHQDEPIYGEVENFEANEQAVYIALVIHIDDWKRLGQPMTTTMLELKKL